MAPRPPAVTVTATAGTATATATGATTTGSVAPAARPPEIGGFLTVVNKARADVGVPPARPGRVPRRARPALGGRVRVADCEPIHSNSRYGENLAKGSNPRYSLADAARLWLDETDVYDRPSNACVNDRECLHHTQVVGRTSTRVGAAGARCRNGWTYVVANFDPPGNWLGRRPY
ncbi:CAP domain-containing protein [Streptomyces bottropensis]|uniref:CAP domain-containing protein n=1 Tax=Streptomyces bottropensis TaxID=42235 RepID=A0ABU8APH1_9ACTN